MSAQAGAIGKKSEGSGQRDPHNAQDQRYPCDRQERQLHISHKDVEVSLWHTHTPRGVRRGYRYDTTSAGR